MIGQLLDDRYRVEAELGHGGMGTVYRAYDTLLNRSFAIKVLNAAGLGTTSWARLLAETRAADLPTGRLQALARLALDMAWIGRCIAAVKRRAGHRAQARGFMGQQPAPYAHLPPW